MKTIFTLGFLLCFVTGFSQNSVAGVWSNSEAGTLILNQDGTGSLNGSGFEYAVEGGVLYAVDNSGLYSFNYKVSGDKLTLSGDLFPTPMVFSKSGSGSSGIKMGSPAAGGGGGIDQSIVGTWCWTNAQNTSNATSSNTRCVIIKGDGTYNYTYEGSISGYGGGYYGGSNNQDSDHGTWRLNGNQIQVNSAKEGQAVYSFEKRNHPKTGDPMIIIDGDAYVTYYQKAPW